MAAEVELIHLRRFMAIVDTRSFVEAARRMHITQQAMSASIAKLEATAGVRFLDRKRGGAVELTSYGRLLATRAANSLALSDRLMAEIGMLRDARDGSVVIGIGETMTGRAVADAIRRFHHDRPDARVRIIEGYTEGFIKPLLANEMDFVIGSLTYDPADARDLEVRHLFQVSDILAVRAGHPLAALEPVGLRELADFPWMIPGFRGDVLKAIERAYARADLRPPRSILQSDAQTIGIQLCLDGEYVLSVSPELIGYYLQVGAMVTLDVPGPWIEREACVIVSRRATLSPLAEALLNEILSRTAPSAVAQTGDRKR